MTVRTYLSSNRQFVRIMQIRGQPKKKKKKVLTALHLLRILWHIIWSDRLQELYIVVWVISCHFLQHGLVRSLNIQERKWLKQNDISFTERKTRSNLENSRKEAKVDKIYSHRSPFSCRGHSSAADYGSFESDVVSWDALARSNSSRCHLLLEMNKTRMKHTRKFAIYPILQPHKLHTHTKHWYINM